MDISSLLTQSLEEARSMPTTHPTPRLLHRARSRHWLDRLAVNFRAQHPHDPDVRVLVQHDDAHQKEFGRNEFLYDLLVCRVGTVPSARHRKDLVYIRDVLWQIESEFARLTPGALRLQ